MTQQFPLPQSSPQLVRGLYPEVGTTGALAGQVDILLTGIPSALSNNPEFVGQVTLEEIHRDEMEIVDHPIQQGANVSDHAFKKPAELMLRIGWDGAALIANGLIQPGEPSNLYIQQLQAIYNQLLAGQQAAVLYTVVTGKRLYSQMLIKDMVTQSDEANENVLILTIHMRQIFIVNTQIISVNAPQSALSNPESNFPVQQNGRTQLTPAPNFSFSAYSRAVPPPVVLTR